jgi:nonsense-mediated mRNA decay protein 3
MDGEFCVVCGATDRPLTDGVCAECAAGRVSLLEAPERAVVVICPHCGARRTGATWERAGSSPLLTAEDLLPLLRIHPEVGVRRIRWEEVSATGTVRQLVGTADVRFRGLERSAEVRLSVRTEHQTCPECSRKSGRYYTAVLQLRGGLERTNEKSPALHARLDRAWSELLAESRSDWRKAVSWTEELPEGYDVFFTQTLAARAVAKLAKQRYGVKVKESATLFGRKDGQDVYRVTLCLRFPRGEASGPDGAAPRGNVERLWE